MDKEGCRSTLHLSPLGETVHCRLEADHEGQHSYHCNGYPECDVDRTPILYVFIW